MVALENSDITAASIWAQLSILTDPEIPVLTLAEMGILRDVVLTPSGWEVHVTPTYSGCPAMEQIEEDIRSCLKQASIPAKVIRVLSPAWTTDWMSAFAREKLREYGIAPPSCHAQGVGAATTTHVLQRAAFPTNREVVACPRCGSENTVEQSYFGSTACKALYRCLSCREPFDYFKPY